MIRQISYLRKPMSQYTIQDSAKVLNKVAQNNKKVAQEFVSQGLRGNVTPTFIKKTGGGAAFEYTGLIKPRFLELISAKYGLDADSTIGDYFLAILRKEAK